MVKWPPTRGWKGYFESHGTNYSSGCLIVVSSMIFFRPLGRFERKWQVLSSEALPPGLVPLTTWEWCHFEVTTFATNLQEQNAMMSPNSNENTTINEWIFLWLGFYDFKEFPGIPGGHTCYALTPAPPDPTFFSLLWPTVLCLATASPGIGTMFSEMGLM